MAKTVAQLITEIATNLPSGNPSVLTAASLRTTLGDIVGSFQPVTQVNAQVGTTYTTLVGDLGLLVTLNNGSPVAVTQPQAIGSFVVFDALFKNLGAGTATITPTTSTINGGASLALPQNYSAIVVSDATNYQAIIVPPVSLTGQLSLAPTSGDAFSITGVANSNSKGISVTQSGPTSGSVAGPISLNLITISSYNAATNAGSKYGDNGVWTSAISGFRVNMNAGGANIGNTEPFFGILGHIRMTTATTTSVATDFEGVAGVSYINAASSGSGTTHEGVVGGVIADASANVGFIAAIFAEADIINGGTVGQRFGLNIDSEGTGRATGNDAMIGLAAANNTGNYKTGILINTAGGGQPIVSTGDFIASVGASSGAFTLANFINLPNMTVTGQVISTQKFNVRGTDGFTNIGNAITPDSLLTVNGNTVATTVAPSATTYLHIVGADSAIPRITMDAFTGAGVIGGVFGARQARGTAAVPTATQANDFLFIFGTSGFQGGGAYGSALGQIAFQATENFSAGHNGQLIIFTTVPTGTSTATPATTIQASGGMTVGNIATDPGAGAIIANTSIKSQGATAGIGYATGAGGTVTQGAGSGKATAVTLNTATGAITMNNAALNAATIVTFVFNNTAVASTDEIFTTHESTGTTGAYTINARATGAGTAAVDVRNNTGGSLSEAIVIRFFVGKSVNA